MIKYTRIESGINMKTNKINGSTFAELLRFGYRNLSAHYEAINDLNVFPVPDGDTGTNMKLTYSNGLKTISDDDASVSQIADEFARGMLFGARGNSGVLTSQYFRGLADALKGLQNLSVANFANAMFAGYKNAYKACVDPQEGTILTVAREGIEKITLDDKDDFATFLTKIITTMKVSLDNTPNLLPVLKENGVIDSGGKGLLTIFEGYLSFFTGEEIPFEEEKKEIEESHESAPSIDYSAFNENSVLDYGYCTEFLLQLLTSKIDIPSFDINQFIDFMQKHGDSLVCFQTGTIVKVHIHTKKPYEVIEYAQKFGEFVSFKMENMALQHNSLIKEDEKKKHERKAVAFVAVAQGDGIIDTFKNNGCDLVLNGGQTMNTSVSELIDAFNYVNADEIFVLPNESNMIKACEQAADLYKDSKVRVIPTKTLQEGYFVLTNLKGLPQDEYLYESLLECRKQITSLVVFKSGKEAKINGEVAPKGSYVGAIRHDLKTYADNKVDATMQLLKEIPDIENKELMFIIYGQHTNISEVERVMTAINDRYFMMEVGLVDGKQDVYDLLIGIL